MRREERLERCASDGSVDGRDLSSVEFVLVQGSWNLVRAALLVYVRGRLHLLATILAFVQ